MNNYLLNELKCSAFKVTALVGLTTLLATTSAFSVNPAGDDRGVVVPDGVAVVHTNSLADLLVGSDAGLQSISVDGAPGAGAEIVLRGVTSLRSSQQPLIILDGVEINTTLSQMANPLNLSNPYTNQKEGFSWATSDLDALYNPLIENDYQQPFDLLSYVDLSTVESIEILKNASATAIYGSRGANGVIIIKRRRDVAEEKVIRFSSAVAVSTISRKLDLLSSDQYSSYYKQLTGDDYSASGAGIDWQDAIYSPSVSTINRLELAGGGKSTSYGLDIMYNRENGVVAGTNATTLSFGSFINQRISRRFNAGAMIDLSKSNYSMTQSSAMLGQPSAFNLLSAAPFEGSGYSALDFINDYEDVTTMWNITPRLHLTGDFGRVMFDLEGGVSVQMVDRGRWYGDGTSIGETLNGVAGLSFYDKVKYDLNFGATTTIYKKGQHNLSARLAGNYYGDTFTNRTMQGTDFFNHTLKSSGVRWAGVTSKQLYVRYLEQSIAGVAKLDYSFGDLVDLNGGLRADRNIAIKDDISYYPFAEAELNLDSLLKPFIEPLSISKLALRGGWGVSGLDSFSPYYEIESYLLGANPLDISYETQLSYMTRYESRVEQYNVGLDLGLLDGRLSAAVDYYDGVVEDNLSVVNTTSRRIDNATIYNNLIESDKSGWEISIAAQPIVRGDFSWDLSASIAFDKISVNSIPSSTSQLIGATGSNGFVGATIDGERSVTAYLEGYAPGVFIGYETDGLVGEQHLDFVPPFGSTRLAVGDVKFVDQTGDGVVDEDDMVVIGDPNPDFVANFNTTFRYKAWSLNMNFSASYGNDVMNLTLLDLEGSNGSNILSHSYTDAWSVDAQDNLYPAVGYFGGDQITDRLVEDGSYLRLSKLQLSYDFSMQKVKWVSSLQLSLMATNLLTITGYSGYDPAVNSMLGEWSLRGVDMGSYPTMRSVSLGVNAKF